MLVSLSLLLLLLLLSLSLVSLFPLSLLLALLLLLLLLVPLVLALLLLPLLLLLLLLLLIPLFLFLSCFFFLSSIASFCNFRLAAAMIAAFDLCVFFLALLRLLLLSSFFWMFISCFMLDSRSDIFPIIITWSVLFVYCPVVPATPLLLVSVDVAAIILSFMSDPVDVSALPINVYNLNHVHIKSMFAFYVYVCVCACVCVCVGTFTITISITGIDVVMTFTLYFSLLYPCQTTFIPCIVHQVVVSKVRVCYDFVIAPEYSVIRYYTKKMNIVCIILGVTFICVFM